jgi:prephenate dehydrogenase
MFKQLSVIGCGLMGGSFALAARRAGLVKRVVGYSKSPTTTKRALSMGVIDAEASSMLRAMAGADLVLVAVPVSATESVFENLKHLRLGNILAMDVGSTKRDVVECAKRALGYQAHMFVPAHPIAGREVSGVAYSDADLYTGKQVVLTPTDTTSPEQVKRATEIWQALGSYVTLMTPEEHDRALSAVSHFPHLAAFALMLSLIDQPECATFLNLAGPGFRDFTRIAAAEPHMWRDVLMANQDQVRHQSRLFRKSLVALEHLISQGKTEDLIRMITEASHARASWKQTATPTSARQGQQQETTPRSKFSLSNFFGSSF